MCVCVCEVKGEGENIYYYLCKEGEGRATIQIQWWERDTRRSFQNIELRRESENKIRTDYSLKWRWEGREKVRENVPTSSDKSIHYLDHQDGIYQLF